MQGVHCQRLFSTEAILGWMPSYLYIKKISLFGVSKYLPKGVESVSTQNRLVGVDSSFIYNGQNLNAACMSSERDLGLSKHYSVLKRK